VTPVPTWRLAVLVALAAGVVVVAPVGLAVSVPTVNVVALVLAVTDWVAAVHPGHVVVSRQPPARAVLGEETELTWQLTNTAGRPVRAAIADELAPSLNAADRRLRIALPAGATATVRTALRPSRRGRFTPTRLVVRTAGPLGLVSRQAGRRLPGTLRVYPAFRSRRAAELRARSALEGGLRPSATTSGGTEFDSLREYGPDDEFRAIDWAATARAGEAIVRTYRPERNRTVLVLLDTGRLMAARVGASGDAELGAESRADNGHAEPDAEAAGTLPRLDHAMDAVMALATVATRLGDRCGLLAFADDVRSIVPPAQPSAQLGRVTEALYDLHPRLSESDFHGAFVTMLSRFPRRALVVVVSELAESAIAETLLPALPLVAGRHAVVVAGVADPTVTSWAQTAPADASQAYRKAAAVATLDQRRRTTARLRTQGATVVDEVPERFAPRLADAYLGVKETGRL
jgi:uncharacterized protein (DUF58 family)